MGCSPDASRRPAPPLQTRGLRLRKAVSGQQPAGWPDCSRPEWGLCAPGCAKAPGCLGPGPPPPAHRLQDRAGDRAAPSAWEAGEEAPSEGPTEAGRAPHRGLRARFLGRGWGIGLRRAEEGWPGRGQSGPQRDGRSCKPRGSHGAAPEGHMGRSVAVSGVGPAPQSGPESRRGGQDSAWAGHCTGPPKTGRPWTRRTQQPRAEGGL